MRRLIPFLFLFLVGCSTDHTDKAAFDLNTLPKDTNAYTYKLEGFIPAAMSLQAMGSTAGSEALLRAAKTADYDDYEKIVVLCRMLFKFREGQHYIYPSLG